jgi:hypothetical protein
MSTLVQKRKLSAIANVDEEKNALAIKLLSLKDISLVQAFKVIFDDLTTDSVRITKKQYNKEIDGALKRVKAGHSVSNEEVMKEMEKW